MSASEAFVAEICLFGFNFPPTGWAQCNGQILPISQNTALFALLGTTYGGDGKSTFALPNLQGSVPICIGQGPGLSERLLGERSGVETVTLLESEIPVHSHTFRASNVPADSPVGTQSFIASPGNDNIYLVQNPNATMAPQMLSVTGASLPHSNMMPYLTLQYCIALQGIFPQRS